MPEFVTKSPSGIFSTEFKVIDQALGQPKSLRIKELPRIHYNRTKFGDYRRVLKKSTYTRPGVDKVKPKVGFKYSLD